MMAARGVIASVAAMTPIALLLPIPPRCRASYRAETIAPLLSFQKAEVIYDLTFRYGQAGMASALSWLLFLVILVVTLVQFYGQKKWVNYA